MLLDHLLSNMTRNFLLQETANTHVLEAKNLLQHFIIAYWSYVFHQHVTRSYCDV